MLDHDERVGIRFKEASLRLLVLAVALSIGSSPSCFAFRNHSQEKKKNKMYSSEDREKIGGIIPNRDKAFMASICARVPPSRVSLLVAPDGQESACNAGDLS